MPQKIKLALDSSGPTLSVGIQAGEKIYCLRKSGIKQERFFLPLVERALAKAGAGLKDIGEVFFVRGPGRFTGLRISLTFASMLASLNGTQTASATLFEILYKQVADSVAFAKWKKENPAGGVAVVLHAFREEYFLQIFDEKHAAPQWLSRGELLQQLAAYAQPLYVAGTDKDGASLAGLLGGGYRLAPLTDSRVRMQTLLEMSQNPLYRKNAMEPLYLKPARFELGR